MLKWTYLPKIDRVNRSMNEHFSFQKTCVHSFVIFSCRGSKGLGSPPYGALIVVLKPPFGFEMSNIISPKI
jgi:hypothetical protein